MLCFTGKSIIQNVTQFAFKSCYFGAQCYFCPVTLERCATGHLRGFALLGELDEVSILQRQQLGLNVLLVLQDLTDQSLKPRDSLEPATDESWDPYNKTPLDT